MPRQMSVSKAIKINSIGQSLLEVVVLIGLALVIVTGLTVVTVNGLKNSQFSQNQAQATRLAQDAVDKIRTMKDQNCPIDIGGTQYYWYDNLSLIWDHDPAGASFKFITVNCGPSQPSGVGLQNPADPGGMDLSIPDPLESTFTRKIQIVRHSAPPNAQQKITVTVSWTDLSGTHQSDLTTIVGQN